VDYYVDDNRLKLQYDHVSTAADSAQDHLLLSRGSLASQDISQKVTPERQNDFRVKQNWAKPYL